MKKRIFEKMGIETSLLGFGCMRFPQTDDGKIDEDKSLEMLDLAISNGVNYLDTAWPYHNNTSEEFVGRVLKKYDRESLFIATKLPLWECKKIEDVEAIFNKQLKKLDIDYIDFYLIHAVSQDRINDLKEYKVMETLSKLRDEGKIKYIGFSFHDDLDAFKLWVDLWEWDFVQIQLNYMDIDHQQGIEGYHLLVEKGIPCIVMEPVKGGKLASFRNDIEGLFKNVHPERSIASWAFRWVASLENVKVILSGMSTLEQVKDNIDTFSNFEKMNEKEFEVIDTVSKTLNDLQLVSCTNCKYCMPCEFGVDIPRNLNLRNSYNMYNDEVGASWMTNMLNKKEAFANICTNCSICVDKCPQMINIPRELEIVNEKFKRFIK
ncbi:aldo/keto reductase [Mycoplasmatota bacterium zrk1]